MRIFLATLLATSIGCDSNTITGYDEPGTDDSSNITEPGEGTGDGTDDGGTDDDREEGGADDGIDSPSDANEDEDTGAGGTVDDAPAGELGDLGEWTVRAVSSTEVDAEIYLPDGPGQERRYSCAWWMPVPQRSARRRSGTSRARSTSTGAS